MQAYYTIVTALCLMSSGSLSVLVWENNRMSKDDKKLLYLTYALIAVSTLIELLGGWLDVRSGIPLWVLPMVKCVDYIVKPMAGGALVAQMRLHDRWVKAILCILSLNVLLQIVAAFNGWMIVMDANGHYAHGLLYPAYLTACLAIVILVTVESILYGRNFSRQNRVSLFAVMLFVVAGIAMQALLPTRPKAACVAMTMGAALMYIRYMEFSSLEMDDRIEAQRQQIDSDALTGVLNRHAYTQALLELNDASELPSDLVIFVADINGLKQVNDSLGHTAGDELIIGSARCLEAAFDDKGSCYRTGGDEFAVFAHMGHDEVEETLSRLEDETKRWKGALVSTLTMSCGYAIAVDCEGVSAEGLVREADRAMYAVKAAYYSEMGRDRRRS